MSLGLDSGRLAHVQEHHVWAEEFARERQSILEVLVTQPTVVEHVGSTALPGVPAKPILDILVGVPSFEKAHDCIEPMKSLRYEYRGEYGVPGRHYFVKGSPRTHHVHMLEIGGENWGSMLAFRDALLACPDLTREYAHAKVSLAATYRDNRAAYQEAKGRVIERILRRLSARAGPIEKVIAYITRGTQLLVFSQPDFPDAGIQAPGGSVGPNESPQQAVLREALEETGLEGLEIAGFLGTNLYYSPGRRILRQHYFQLVGEGPVPEEWDHWENCPNSGEPSIRFQFWWVDLAEVPELTAGRGALLAKLKSVG